MLTFEPVKKKHASILSKMVNRIGLETEKLEEIIYLQEVSRKPTYFIYFLDGEPLGYMGIIADENNAGYLEGATYPGQVKPFIVANALRAFSQYCFHPTGLGLNKLKAQFLMHNAPAEMILRMVGFRKEGVLLKEIKHNGNYADGLSFALFADGIKGKTDIRKWLKTYNRREKRHG